LTRRDIGVLTAVLWMVWVLFLDAQSLNPSLCPSGDPVRHPVFREASKDTPGGYALPTQVSSLGRVLRWRDEGTNIVERECHLLDSGG
jgi:hypothetical protein